MDGILTASGITSWLSGAKKLVREWDTALLGTTESVTFALFEGASQAGLELANSSGVAAKHQTVIGTSMVKQGCFATPNWTATHLALEVPLITIEDPALPVNDVKALIGLDVAKVQARTWFKMFFDNNLMDQGQLLDFPSGRGMFIGTSTADTICKTGYSNGPISPDARQMLATPNVCTPNTKPKLEVSFPFGALDTLSVVASIKATLYGFTG